MVFLVFMLAGLAAGPVAAYNIYEKDPWGYEAENGPEKWADLDPAFQICKVGKRQSPIDLVRSRPLSDAKTLVFKYKTAPLYINHDGHFINVYFPKGNTLGVQGELYRLVKCTLHLPSEHSINGKNFPMELQFIHKHRKGNLVIVSVLVQAGRFNVSLQSILNALPSNKSYIERISTTYISAGDFLPKDKGYFTYAGSRTTPPCTENVKWYIMKTPIEASANQLKFIQPIIGGRARPPQALNNREVFHGPSGS